jgi:uncharacterized membrane protein
MEEQTNSTLASHDKDVDENKLIAAIGYVWLLCLVPLFLKKDSKFAQFHAKQGLILVVGWFALWVVGWIPILGWLVMMLGSIVIIILAVLGITNALQGKWWEMPVLGEYAKKINL